MKYDLHHKLFFAFLAWMAIGTICSDYILTSLQGFYPYRGEGLITYFIITCIAISYWKNFETIMTLSVICLSFCCLLTVCYLFFEETTFFRVNYDSLFLPDIARASFASESAPLIMLIDPMLAIAAIFPILSTGTRSALIALVVACSIYVYVTKSFKIQKKTILAVIAVLAVSGGLILLNTFQIDHKISKIPKLETMGHGARSSWILQASSLSKSLPLTGYGVDTLSNYLTTPEIRGYENLKKYVPDRVHFLPLDIVLQTGWLGYTLILLCFGYALGVAIKSPNSHNMACICSVIAFIVYGMMNPHGSLAETVALTALMGIRKQI